MWLSSAMALKKDGVLETQSFLDDIEFVLTPEVRPALRIVIWIFYDVVVLHCDSYMRHRVSHVTQTVSHDLVMSSLYKSRLIEERLYKEVNGPETRALHATI